MSGPCVAARWRQGRSCGLGPDRPQQAEPARALPRDGVSPVGLVVSSCDDPTSKRGVFSLAVSFPSESFDLLRTYLRRASSCGVGETFSFSKPKENRPLPASLRLQRAVVECFGLPRRPMRPTSSSVVVSARVCSNSDTMRERFTRGCPESTESLGDAQLV